MRISEATHKACNEGRAASVAFMSCQVDIRADVGVAVPVALFEHV